MGELLQLRGQGGQPDSFTLEQVRSGVFVANQLPPEELVGSGEYVTAAQFGVAGERAGKSANYGQGVMRDIALQMVGIEADTTYTINGVGGYLMAGTPEHKLYWKVRQLMDNPDKIKKGSRARLLLGRQLVHETWAAGEGSQLLRMEEVPRLGKVGQRVVSEVVKLIS
ncbi:hypothetical protein BGO17_02120 [Candidatus Saccharibacteria bacterium 49-20]|nr:MAG: hypothetical protein BGO17_02120 [Candidatus Saccharibacteria bacterium 49-20]